MKKRGIFIKVFIYTIISMILLVFITVVLYSQQFISFYGLIRHQQVSESLQPLVGRLEGKSGNDFPEIAQDFYESNQSFEFYIEDMISGGVTYATPHADTSGSFTLEVALNKDYAIRARSDMGLSALHGDLIKRAFGAFMAMIALCVICAFVFARQMTRPIKTLADAANKMANLEAVPQLPGRRDELGTLARDVYSMYSKLKETISKLEEEILRERELEEAQAFFFSAASHELKTPIAATSCLLEGMLDNVGDYKNHPKYLRECVKMMDAQSKVISEILEIVNLNNGKIVPVPEKLDVKHTFAGMLPDFQIMCEANSQRIVTDIPDGQTCLADPKMLRKAVSNILLNAVQNTLEGGEIRIWSEPVGDQYRLCVLNTGVRIDEAILPKLFDPFYRLDKARSRKNGRSGLGLTIVRKTLESMNINFALENAADGVLFWMGLPKA